jgi:nucleoid-associated protein YgaU
MGSVAQAVLEFDEAVQVPWRPPLGGAPQRPATPPVVRALPSAPHRRPHAARAARLLAVVEPPPAPRPAPAPAASRPSAGGSTALGHTCARCSRSAGRPAPGVRLTRRARRLLAVVGAGVGVLAAAWLGSLAGGGDDELVLVSESSVVVQQGDTVWSIARSVAGEEDVRAVVDRIQELNDLDEAALQPGQVLRLP